MNIFQVATFAKNKVGNFLLIYDNLYLVVSANFGRRTSNKEEITVDEISLVLKTQSVMNMKYFETYQEAKQAFQREFFSHALHAHNWNVSETAKSLKIDRTNLYKKMQKLGIKSNQRD